MSLNSCSLMGRLGKDPEINKTATGRSVLSISICVDKDVDVEERKQSPAETHDWIQLVFWDKKAESLVKYAHKGDQIVVNGRLTTRRFTNIYGKEQFVTEVVVNRYYFTAEPVMKGKGKKKAEPKDESGFTPLRNDEDDLPF